MITNRVTQITQLFIECIVKPVGGQCQARDSFTQQFIIVLPLLFFSFAFFQVVEVLLFPLLDFLCLVVVLHA